MQLVFDVDVLRVMIGDQKALDMVPESGNPIEHLARTG